MSVMIRIPPPPFQSSCLDETGEGVCVVGGEAGGAVFIV